MKTDLKKILGQNWPFGLWYVIGRSVTEWHWLRTLRVIVKLEGPSTRRQGESSCNILCTLLMQNSCRLQCSFKVQFCAREAVTAGQWPLWMHCWPLLNPCTLSSSSSIINRIIKNMMSILIASLIVYLKTTLHFLIPTMILLSDKICTLHNCTWPGRDGLLYSLHFHLPAPMSSFISDKLWTYFCYQHWQCSVSRIIPMLTSWYLLTCLAGSLLRSYSSIVHSWFM